MDRPSFPAAVIFALTVVGAFVTACNDDADAGATGARTPSSCDLTAAAGYCIEFPSDAPKDEAKNNCANAKATLGYEGVLNESGACPTANRTGTCFATINGVKTTYRYFLPTFTSATAGENCRDLHGLFAISGGAINGS